MTIRAWRLRLVPWLLSACTASTLALNTGTAWGVEEATLEKRYFSELVPFVQKEIKSTFDGKGGVKVAYRMFRHVGAKGGIVLVHGYSESTQKNAELIHDLIMAGYNIYSLDLRGMGESGRPVPNPQMGHVADFNDYVDDLKIFVGTIVKPVETGDLFLIGHSTGGLAAALLLERHDDLFKAVAWSAPMFGISTRGVPRWLAYGAILTMMKLGLGEHYVPGFGDYDAKDDQPEHSHVTHSLVRARLASELYQKVPQLRIWGMSNSWVYNGDKYGKIAVAGADAIKTPILLVQAGEDVVVTAEAQKAFCDRAQHCRLLVADGARHETLNETDSIRDKVLNEMLAFFTANASPRQSLNLKPASGRRGAPPKR